MGLPVPRSLLIRNKNLKGIFLLSSQVPPSYEKLSCDIHNITGLNSESVVEHALFFFLKDLREREPAILLSQNKLGVIGLGRIGATLKDKLLSLNAQVSTISRNGQADYHYDHFLEFVGRQDVLFLCLAYHPETKALFNKDFFRSLDSQVRIINVARGELFDEQELFQFFSQNPKARYYTDVTYPEPYPDSGVLRELENIFITPHVAGFDRDLWPRIFQKWRQTSWIK